MSMLIHCKMCHHEYGAWRPQCTACGTPTPKPETLNTPRMVEREKRIRREVTTRVKRECATLCSFCKCRGAKEKCDECGGLVHSFCRHLHKEQSHRHHELRVTS